MCKAKKMCKPGMFWIDFFGPSTFLIIFSLKSMEVKLGRKYNSIWFIFGLRKLNCKNILIWIASRQSKYENIWDSPSPPIDCRLAGRGGGNHKYTQTPIYTTNTLQLEYTPMCYKKLQSKYTPIIFKYTAIEICCNTKKYAPIYSRYILQHKVGSCRTNKCTPIF